MRLALYRRHDFYLGLFMEQGKSYKDVKGNAQAGQTLVRQNTDVLYDGGLSRSSEEVSVMGAERRAKVIQLELPLATFIDKGRDNGIETKSLPITKRMVWEAYKKVRSNKGAAGIDEETLDMYKERLSDNLYILWNRLSSGSYFPPPVLEVEIPKDDGRKRKLGIPTVSDRIAQQVVKTYLEPRFEVEFSQHSYGYRPNKDAHQAIETVRMNVREYWWAIDMDITGFFDNMSHELLMKAVDKHVEEKWAKMYITRWLEAPIEDGERNIRFRNGKGTPQGGVISPLLANLFLHYALDKWLELNYPSLKYVRYADDAIVHCHTLKQAKHLLSAIQCRMRACGLEVNEKKSKIAFCKKAGRKASYKIVNFDFLGFTFQPRPTGSKTGRMFLGFDCAISIKSRKKIAEVFRDSKFHKWTLSDITRIADEFNPKIQGWINYYGRFSKFSLMKVFRIFHHRIMQWALNRYKRFKGSFRKVCNWLYKLSRKQPNLFVHWQKGFQGA
jgi:RNA-directed DNA polymerase